MSPKKHTSSTSQQKRQLSSRKQSQGSGPSQNESQRTPTKSRPAVPEHEVKASSSMSAQLALEAAKKAYDLRQAAYGAGDPNAREEILAKAINKEIEAESFGKAAKYTRSGAFQGLAAGAGLGVQPGVTLGKLTGALVGGLLSSVGALVGGGVGSVYGAINGPFWDLGEMASHGVRSIVGDFPNWEATSSQKKALEKMVLGAQQTTAPHQRELEQMRDDDGGASSQDRQQFANDLTSWLPSIPSMPDIPSMPSMPSIPGLAGLSGANKPNATATTKPSKKDPQPKAPVKTQESAKPPGVVPRARVKTAESQLQPQSSLKSEEEATRKKPRKLEIRSATSTTQPGPPATRRAPPKLETQRRRTTAKA